MCLCEHLTFVHTWCKVKFFLCRCLSQSGCKGNFDIVIALFISKICRDAALTNKWMNIVFRKPQFFESATEMLLIVAQIRIFCSIAWCRQKKHSKLCLILRILQFSVRKTFTLHLQNQLHSRLFGRIYYSFFVIFYYLLVKYLELCWCSNWMWIMVCSLSIFIERH